MRTPNIIVVLTDNLGYGDLGCYGCGHHRTPHIDRLAEQGTRFTSFYSTSGVCTPSRASLMTGCYPRRVNLHCNHEGKCVLFPMDKKGLHADEVTIAGLLKAQGYAAACIGKWHLGDQPPFLPTRHGFNDFLGIPYSEDMVPQAGAPYYPPLPLMHNEEVIEAPIDRDYLTQRYTEAAVRFIRDHRDRPFFLYLAHAMPGSCPEPFASPDFRGTSANGIYGDCVEELDWSQGRIMDTLKELGLDEHTVVIWTSDNGAVRHSPRQGSNEPLRGWGYDTSEGGQRVPCIMRWPDHIPAGTVTDEIGTMMDILPTAAAWAGARVPDDRRLDGYDRSGFLAEGGRTDSPYDKTGFFYYFMGQLQAVRSGPWKLYLPLKKKLRSLSGDDSSAVESTAELYNLRDDIGETVDLCNEHPDILARLSALADNARGDLGDWDREGRNQRPAGWVDEPRPRVMQRADVPALS